MVFPVPVKCIHPVAFFFRNLGAEGFQLAENAIVTDAAEGGDASESDREEIQPPRNLVLVLDVPEEGRIEDLQASCFPHFFGGS